MQESGTNPFSSVSLNAAILIDKICLRFENAIRADKHPQIEVYLTKAKTDSARQALFWGLLRLELEYAAKQGKENKPQEYEQRFPEFTELIARVFREPAHNEPRSWCAGATACHTLQNGCITRAGLNKKKTEEVEKKR